jgi:WD40 repeat protein
MPQPSALHYQWNLKVPIVSLSMNRNGNVLAAALGDGSMRLLAAKPSTGDMPPREVQVHKGVSLSLEADADGVGFLSGGDDGCLMIVDPDGMPTVLVEHKNQWIDYVASTPDGFRAYAIGKNLHVLDEEGKPHGASLAHPSSIGGLQFSPNGKRIAASHYNGLSLWWTNATDTVPVKLEWKGSHLGVLWHPDGKTVMTSMQDASLHGWRLADMHEMRMDGYANKVHSFGYTARGRYLATSGAPQVICWPFFGGGPWGKTPLTLGTGEARLVTRVAPHPKDELVAAGYDDGMIILAPLDGRMEMLIHPPVATKGAGVTGLIWNGAGDCLFAALENGSLLLFTIESVRKSVSHA